MGSCPDGHRGRKRLVGRAGGILLRKLADQCGLTGELDVALARDGTSPQLSQGVVLVSTAIAIAMGATAMAGIALLGQLAPVLGIPPSGSTVRHTLNLADDRTLARVALAKAGIRRHVWAQVEANAVFRESCPLTGCQAPPWPSKLRCCCLT